MLVRHALAVAALAGVAAAAPAAPQWNPRTWTEESTLELRTQAPGEPEHWFKVWLVVIDGDLYVRLGGPASARIESNVGRPIVRVRVAGLEFERVRGVPAPDYADRVMAAMAEKYWSDLLMRWFAHPLTLRLLPEKDSGS
jgi:hypothetical protein